MPGIGILVVLALAAVGLGGSATPAIARTPLSVQAYCWNNGGGNFACTALPAGGTGSYVSYTWKVDEFVSLPFYPYWVVTSTDTFYTTCEVGYNMRVTVTVKDSAGATAVSDYVTRSCSQWPE